MSSEFETTTEIIRPLDERVKKCRHADSKSIQDLADILKCSRPVLSKILSGKNEGSTAIMRRLEEYCERVESENPNLYLQEEPKFIKRGFTQTKDATNVIGVCSATQETGGLGVVVGKSGFGKTHALKYYSTMPRVAYVECDAVMSVRDFLSCVEDALGIPALSSPKIWPRLQSIQAYFKVNTGWLLIVDEADKLISAQADRKIEVLRALFDQSSIGIVVAGEPKLKSLLENYSERFANRVDFYTNLSGLSTDEVKEILDNCKIEDEAMEEIIARATNKKNGCFRLFDRTMDNIGRLLKRKDEEVITLEIIREASGLMMM